jgi:Tfp pilus assembly protein PilN
MVRLDIDFVRSRPRSAWAGRLLFAIAVAVAADAGWAYLRLREALSADQGRLAVVQPRAARKVAAEELTAARETVQRLTLPWTQLFGALESAASPQVALLAIEPDPRTGKVTISGDSKDYLAALTYVLNLRRAEGLANVELVRHEQTAADPRRPVAFSISATWGSP